jgi:leader peptidase (prepilin peptidase)/N-methyltransferase
LGQGELSQTLADQGFQGLVASLFGLLVGSFANVAIHRLPDREEDPAPEDGRPRTVRELLLAIVADFRPDWSYIARCWARVAHPKRSHCPRCQAAIRATDNVPIVSFLLLGARCRNCGAPISWRYPLVEAANAALWGGIVALHGASAGALALLPFATALLVLALIDSDLQQLPDALTVPGTLLGLGASLLSGRPAPHPGTPLDALLAALLGYAMLALLTIAWRILRGLEALGQGDWKMAAMLGAWLGGTALLLTVFVAAFCGSLVGGALILARRGDMQSKLPLGTFLGLAGILVLFAGQPLLDWYRGILGG